MHNWLGRLWARLIGRREQQFRAQRAVMLQLVVPFLNQLGLVDRKARLKDQGQNSDKNENQYPHDDVLRNGQVWIVRLNVQGAQERKRQRAEVMIHKVGDRTETLFHRVRAPSGLNS